MRVLFRTSQNVPETLEAIRHAGIKIWMLTGDKVETATCIAVSAGLKTRHDTLAILSSATIKTPSQVTHALECYVAAAAAAVGFEAAAPGVGF